MPGSFPPSPVSSPTQLSRHVSPSYQTSRSNTACRPIRNDSMALSPGSPAFLNKVVGERITNPRLDIRYTKNQVPNNICRSTALTMVVEQLEASIMPWFAPHQKSDKTWITPAAIVDPPPSEPTTIAEPDFERTTEQSTSQPETGSAASETSCKPHETWPKFKFIHWIKSIAGRPVSSVRLFNPLGPIQPSIVTNKLKDSNHSTELPVTQAFIVQPLTTKWESKVYTALSQPDSRQLATTISGDGLTRRDLATCATPLAWLNDEIINAYLGAIVDYARRSNCNSGRHEQPRYHAFNTFFYSSLRDKGYESVRRWASRAKIGGPALMNVDMVFAPIHHHSHWTLMVVKPSVRTIEHFDSLGSSSSFHIANVKKWLRGELGHLFVDEEWQVLPSTSPQQNNGSDCGVFLLTTAKLVSLGQPLSYGPKNIPTIRKRIVAELLNGGFDGDFDPKAELPVNSLL
ncbi:hypothetical protein LOZ51_005212 [Ophidiomyces ophidiicola]|nr:hypothetical protein LOZ51_005212 [Ophidiomyces ophidiicola]KAI1991001.1 hypothetical protein LOZ54_002279 [Ophidiomyces ophidiicola]